jgi:hypothetical protein
MPSPVVRIRRVGMLALAALALVACGSSITTTPPVTGGSDDFGSDVPVHVTPTRLKPSLLHLFEGLEVTFVNDDSVARMVAVDPSRSTQPGCAAVGIGTLQPGERRTSAALPRFAGCYFLDPQRPSETSFIGLVITH